MKDAEHLFFRPLWRRIAVVAVCVAWSGLELWGGQGVWLAIALAATAYAVWTFLISYKEPPAP